MARSQLSTARAQLRDAATAALAGALDALEARVSRDRAVGIRLVDRPRQLDRTREVLERDRALAFATAARPQDTPGPTPPSPPALVPPKADSAAIACDEPIRTRSMAKLLAAQGHPDRALAIYRYLLARDGGDPSLQAEIAALGVEQPPHG